MTEPLHILVFSPDPPEAEKYRQLLEGELTGVKLSCASTLDQARPVLDSVEVIVGWKFPAGLLAGARALKWVHKVSAGVEDVVSDPARPASLRLSRSDGAVIAPRMVEYVLSAIYLTTQKLMLAVEQQRGKVWNSYPIGLAAGRTVGVAGLGDIGMAIAGALHRNGMRVVGWRRSEAPKPACVDRVYVGGSQLNQFAGACDFLVSVLPATGETRNVFDATVFAAMRPGAVFINVGRGSSVDETALASAIADGHLGGAVLDVFQDEPLPAASPLWNLDGIVVTPHVSGPIVPEDVVPRFIENVRRYRAGEMLLKEVDFSKSY